MKVLIKTKLVFTDEHPIYRRTLRKYSGQWLWVNTDHLLSDHLVCVLPELVSIAGEETDHIAVLHHHVANIFGDLRETVICPCCKHTFIHVPMAAECHFS